MRADRLLSILMILQQRGQVNAAALAAELEVSERTIYRDMDALSLSGVPVYSERGPEGGYRLVESYRTTLTGLNADEQAALFMLGQSQPLRQLGVGTNLAQALRKLGAALTDQQRHAHDHVQQRLHLDATWWFQDQAPPSLLQSAYQAVWKDRMLSITYPLPPPTEAVLTRVVAPYGLVAKAGIWYLVYEHGGRWRARRVDALVAADPLSDVFKRAEGFELIPFWQAWCAHYEQDRPRYEVTMRADPGQLSAIAQHLGAALETDWRQVKAESGPWVTLRACFETLPQARERLLSLGGCVVVVAPEPLRRSMADYGRRIAARYGK